MDKELQVVRVIHPVGQGAFYSETLHQPGINDDKHIVYDCGVMPYSARLEEEIKNFLPNGSAIDVMFISHFHADHVNGLKLLAARYKIRNLVLPQIDNYEWFYFVENYLTMGDTNINLISDVLASVGDAKIIQVAPRDENDTVGVSDESAAIDGLGGEQIFNGLSPLVIDKQDFALWHYTVVNPLIKADLWALRTAIENIDYDGRKIRIEDLYNPEILNAIRNDLQDVYEKIFKGGNEYSMCMLSELANRKDYESYSWFNLSCRLCERYWFGDYRSIDGALYSGDADFLHCDTLDCLKKRLAGKEGYVGMLQLPHHGSKENFNIELLNWLNSVHVSFACYGTPNRYNHPSSDVMGTAGTFSRVVGVNQTKSNVLTERIDVKRREGRNV